MQEPTHILTGIIIQRSCAHLKPRGVALGLTAATAFLSHGFLDELSRVTYHPAKADFHSVVWVCYHSTILLTTIAFLWLWWRKFKWGIFFAALPDLDWVFIHGQQLLHVSLPFYQQPHLHNLLHIVYHQIPPFAWVTALLVRLPYNRENPWACLWEALLVATLLLVIRLMTMAERPARVAASRKSAAL